tara:strand:- start:37 stop:2475 length:2439 start_codon:yes stop_codon:yes gene_type:complete
MSVEDQCPLSIPVPFSVTVNTSGSTPSPTTNVHSLSDTHSGFTRISEFTFTSILTGDPLSINDYATPPVSETIAVWDFGDGHTLSAADTPTTTHTYNVPGIYTVSVFYYDIDGRAYYNTLSESVSVYNYIETNIKLPSSVIDSVTATGTAPEGIQLDASSKNTFQLGISASWQDTIETDEYTVYATASGSKSKPYDTNSKYAHLVPFNAFYSHTGDLIPSTGLKCKLEKVNYAIEPLTNKIIPIHADKIDYFEEAGFKTYVLGSINAATLSGANNYKISGNSTLFEGTEQSVGEPTIISYYDDTPNISPGVELLFKFDTSQHKVKNFYVDNIETDINNSGQPFLETGGIASKRYVGILVKINKTGVDYNNLFSFTSTGMKEMSGINYKRQGDKFQVFIALQDKNKNILKHYPKFLLDTTGNVGELSADNTFNVSWVSGGDTHTSNISSLSTNKFPYNTTTGHTELSSYLYLNIDPLSAGTWSLNVSAAINSLSAGTGALSGFTGNIGNVGDDFQHYTGSYTFTVYPSTNDVEFYLDNEDIDYSKVLKSYRFQSFMHQYDNLFDGIFTSFVGEASSSPTTFGKTVFSKIANFVNNHSDVDLCKIDQIQSFYDLLNEDIDIILPAPPSELKRLYDTFSIKVSKLLGSYEQFSESLNSNFYTSSADGRNIDFDNPITAKTYTVTAYTNFVARQKFNNEFLVLKPQKIATKHVDGSSSGLSTTYPLSTYNLYSNWGWELDTTISGASGLSAFYDFYPYTTYDTTSADENLKHNLIDYDNIHTTITRSASSLSGNWNEDDGIIYKNLDYQLRKGLNI